jgi:hypothetical protein
MGGYATQSKIKFSLASPKALNALTDSQQTSLKIGVKNVMADGTPLSLFDLEEVELSSSRRRRRADSYIIDAGVVLRANVSSDAAASALVSVSAYVSSGAAKIEVDGISFSVLEVSAQSPNATVDPNTTNATVEPNTTGVLLGSDNSEEETTLTQDSGDVTAAASVAGGGDGISTAVVVVIVVLILIIIAVAAIVVYKKKTTGKNNKVGPSFLRRASTWFTVKEPTSPTVNNWAARAEHEPDAEQGGQAPLEEETPKRSKSARSSGGSSQRGSADGRRPQSSSSGSGGRPKSGKQSERPQSSLGDRLARPKIGNRKSVGKARSSSRVEPDGDMPPIRGTADLLAKDSPADVSDVDDAVDDAFAGNKRAELAASRAERELNLKIEARLANRLADNLMDDIESENDKANGPTDSSIVRRPSSLGDQAPMPAIRGDKGRNRVSPEPTSTLASSSGASQKTTPVKGSGNKGNARVNPDNSVPPMPSALPPLRAQD